MAESFATDLDYATFKEDNLRLYAVTRCLEIISEASRRLPDALKAPHPSIEWQQMAAAGTSIVMRTRTYQLGAYGPR